MHGTVTRSRWHTTTSNTNNTVPRHRRHRPNTPLLCTQRIHARLHGCACAHVRVIRYNVAERTGAGEGEAQNEYTTC